MSAPHALTLAQALAAIEAGELEAADVLASCLARIAAREPQVGAWQHLDAPDALIARTRAAARTSPLRGLPFGVKDVIDVAGMPTTCGTAIHAGEQPVHDAAAVALLRGAGGVPIGKTVTTELACFEPGRTANPHDLHHTPGGSSSGSAAAVADLMVPFALGTQTAASVIRPAAYCGVVGYVAGGRELPLRGVQALSPSVDALGVLARDVEDVRIVRSLLLERRLPDPPAPSRTARLAVWDGAGVAALDAAMAATLHAAIARLEGAGFETAPLGCGEALAELTDLHERVMGFEAARELAVEAAQQQRLSARMRALLADGARIGWSVHRRTLERVEALRAHVAVALDGFDAVLAPAAPGPAPHGLEATGPPHLSRSWQLLGRPALALPAGRDDAGLPLGLQLVGRRRGSEELLALGAGVAPLFDPAERRADRRYAGRHGDARGTGETD